LIKKRYFRALVAGATVIAAASIGGVAYGVTSSTALTVKGSAHATGRDPDHQQFTFTLAPGTSYAFALPERDVPISIDIAATSSSGDIQAPSQVFSALIDVDKDDVGMSWIGTNSNGSQSASSTTSRTDIANLVCGTNCLIASLDADIGSPGTVVLETDAATSETYAVNVWY
jgi:hypothetical protein